MKGAAPVPKPCQRHAHRQRVVAACWAHSANNGLRRCAVCCDALCTLAQLLRLLVAVRQGVLAIWHVLLALACTSL